MAVDPVARALFASMPDPVNVTELNVTQNGTYDAPSGTAYSPVNVDVPNTYVQSDEGKVVSNGALVAQTSTSVTQNGTIDTTLNNSVTVNVSGGGGTSLGVKFIDYDGTVLHTYTKEQFALLESMPENPTHTGLTSQGWNWSLSDAKSYVADYGELVIGQMYITTDRKTRLHVSLGKGRLHPYVGFGINGTATIDWGDGSTSTVTGSDVDVLVYSNHTYANAGDYVVTIDGQINILGGSHNSKMFCKGDQDAQGTDTVYLNCIQKVELGNIYGFSTSAFYLCYSLTSITIPNAVTSIGGQAFYGCQSLKSITIPDGVTSIGNNAFSNCYSLASIIISDTVTSIGQQTFYNCCSLTSITIPNTVTSIGTNAFTSCYSLQSINIPNSVTSIGGSAFQNCYSLQSVVIPNGVTIIGNNAFYNCYSFTTIDIPNTVTSIGQSAFRSCSSITSITIPNTVTSLNSNVFQGCGSLQSITLPNTVTSIGQSAIQTCYSLTSIDIPSSVTSISAQAFLSCTGLGEIHFKSTTPPKVANSTVWSGLPSDCNIYVPASSLSTYTSATNYPNPNYYHYYGE